MHHHPDLFVKPLLWGGGRCVYTPPMRTYSSRRIAQADPCVNSCHTHSCSNMTGPVGPWLPHGRPHRLRVASAAGGEPSAAQPTCARASDAPGKGSSGHSFRPDPAAARTVRDACCFRLENGRFRRPGVNAEGQGLWHGRPPTLVWRALKRFQPGRHPRRLALAPGVGERTGNGRFAQVAGRRSPVAGQ